MDLDKKKKEAEDSNKSEELESVRSDDDEFEKEEKLKALCKDIAKLEKEVAAFGHVQGCNTPFAELIDPGKTLGAGWIKVVFFSPPSAICIICLLLSILQIHL